MRKLLLLTAGAFFFYAPLNAQTPITLDSAGYVLSTRDTFKGDATANNFPNLSPDTNASWTLGSLNYQSTIFAEAHLPTTPSYLYEDSTFVKFNHSPYPPVSPMPELIYHTQYYTSILGSGIIQYGENLPPQKYGIGTITGDTLDTIKFNPQNIIYSGGNKKILALPATYQNTWSSSYDRSVNFNLSIAAYSLNDVPCVRKTHVHEIDSVVGWGKMRVKTLAATISGYMNVLQVKSMIISSDTFYINGNPAPDSVLAPFNLHQAMPDTIDKMDFYRVGEVSPLLDVEFYDDFGVLYFGKVHVQRLPATGNVTQVNNGDDAITIYPNPVTSDKVSFDLPVIAKGKWTYEIINITGEHIIAASLPISTGQKHMDIALPKLSTGIYYLSVKNDDKQVLVRPIDVRN